MKKSIINTSLFFALLLLPEIIYCQPTPSCDSTVIITKDPWHVDFAPTPYDPPPGNPPQTEFRKVFWVSGLGGNPGAWQNAGAATQDNLVSGYPARKVESEYPDLSDFHSHINVTASVLKGQIRTITEAAGQTEVEAQSNIIIAGSQGGIVSRYLDMIYEQDGERKVGGIVTFCSPHLGAAILNNALPDGTSPTKIQQFVEEACVALKAGPIEETIETSFLLDLFLSGEQVNRITDTLCHYMTETIPFLLQNINQQIARDYMVGAPVVDSLNTYVTTTPRVAFYGIENPGEEFWRVMYYLLNSVNDEPIFEGENDDRGVAFADQNRMKYQAKVESWTNLANNWGPFINYLSTNNDISGACELYGIDTSVCNSLEMQGNNFSISLEEVGGFITQWRKGYNWWLNANDYWLEVNGGLEYIAQGNGVNECWCRIVNNQGAVVSDWAFHSAYSANLSECNTRPLFGGLTEQCQIREGSVMVGVYKPNDGILLAESAGGWPDTPAWPLEGTSHQQKENDSNTKQRLLELWEGGIHNQFFETGVR